MRGEKIAKVSNFFFITIKQKMRELNVGKL